MLSLTPGKDDVSWCSAASVPPLFHMFLLVLVSHYFQVFSPALLSPWPTCSLAPPQEVQADVEDAERSWSSQVGRARSSPTLGRRSSWAASRRGTPPCLGRSRSRRKPVWAVGWESFEQRWEEWEPEIAGWERRRERSTVSLLCSVSGEKDKKTAGRVSD